MRFYISLLAAFLIIPVLHAQRTISLASPDKKISYMLSLKDNDISYSVRYNNQLLVQPSSIGFTIDNKKLEKPKLSKPAFRNATESYDLVVGKTSQVTTTYREVNIPVIYGNTTIVLTVRAFNDALAWRYTFSNEKTLSSRQPKQAKNESMPGSEQTRVEYASIGNNASNGYGSNDKHAEYKNASQNINEPGKSVSGSKQTLSDEKQEKARSTIAYSSNLNHSDSVFSGQLPALTLEDPSNNADTDSFIINNEHTEINLAGNPLSKLLFLPNFHSSHEGLYHTQPYNDIPQDTLIDMPALFQFPQNVYLAITEAALLDYAGMSLVKHGNTLHGTLSPYPDRPGVKVISTYPHSSPWRVLMIGNRIGTLIESNVLTSLNAPCAIENTSWIKPGKTTFPWWNGNVVPDTLNPPGNNFVTQQYYIDFCARNHIEYHSVVEYGLHQWYMDDGIPYSPGPHSDVTTPVPTLNMKEVCDYAHSKGVDIRVWVHWAALYPKIDSAFAIFERWGISGMMVDFMDRDDQQMVNIQTEILQKAAKHHLHIQFHGAYKPTGLSRTYPNEYTREGTYNYENLKWGNQVTTDHDLNILFTRGLAGSTDYHLGGFRFVNDTAFKIQFTRPLIMSTRCHMLAMYVVMENYLGMVCDYPAAYEGQPGFEFITKVPTTWDETRVIDAQLDGYLVIARRKNNNWYLGAVGNHAAHELNIPLDFLGEGNYTAEEFVDTKETLKDPNVLAKNIVRVDRSSSLKITLQPNGGAAVIFSK